MILVRVARATRDSKKRDEAPVDPTVENVISTVGAVTVPRTNTFTCCPCQMRQPESPKVDAEILKILNAKDEASSSKQPEVLTYMHKGVNKKADSRPVAKHEADKTAHLDTETTSTESRLSQKSSCMRPRTYVQPTEGDM